MRYVIVLLTLILLLVAGKALTEDTTGAGDNNPRPHAIDVTEPPAEAAAEAPQEELPPEESEQPVDAAEPAQQQPPPDEQTQLLDAAELDQLVAPIALYPDALLAQVLIAATYPLEVVEADRFVQANKALKGNALEAELAKQDWDDSVKALAEAPEILAMMSAELDWMQSLGDAVLAQQPDVMEAVQRLRAKAEATGKLANTEQQKVVVNQDAGQREIVIQPAQPEIVYVPYYEPQAVYGPWPHPSHPPYAFAPPPRYAPAPRYRSPGPSIATAAIAFGAGYLLGRAMEDDIDWRDRHIRVHRPRHGYYNRGHRPRPEIYRSNWKHNAHHRRGVKYKNAEVWRKYAKGNKARAKPKFAAPRKPGGYYGALPRPHGTVKPVPHAKFGAARNKVGPPKVAKPPKQFTRKPPGGHAAVGPKKPPPKVKPPKPSAAAYAAKPRPGPHGKAAAPKPNTPPNVAEPKSPPKVAQPKAPANVTKPKVPQTVAQPKGHPKVAKAKAPNKPPIARGPGKPPKAAYQAQRKPPHVAKGRGSAKGHNAAARAGGKPKTAAKNGRNKYGKNKKG